MANDNILTEDMGGSGGWTSRMSCDHEAKNVYDYMSEEDTCSDAAADLTMRDANMSLRSLFLNIGAYIQQEQLEPSMAM